ncbi:MAG: hypothetical protein QOJ82_3224 [Solirubrobacteraceae bacterium]|jgi:hypothetical protein|nr:hypothetical protein [Solirubrobacteraceae bacterium]
MSGESRVQVRSYRTVFDLERRLYRIDRWRLNPGGVPVRGVVYAVVLAVLAAVAMTLPLVGAALGVVPWPLRHLLLPGMLAAALTLVRIDGRAVHVALGSLIAFVWQAHRRNGLGPAASTAVWRPQEVVVIPDGSEGRSRRVRFRGPGAVAVGVEHELRDRRMRRVVLRAGRPTSQRKVIVLSAGATLDVANTGSG